MQRMYAIEKKTSMRGVQAPMPGLLHQTGAERLPEQDSSGRDARSYCAVPWEPWPGASVGVRAPRTGETPLSAAEVGHGLKTGLL